MANTEKINGYYRVGASEDGAAIKSLEQKTDGIVREGTPRNVIGVTYFSKDYVRDAEDDGVYMDTSASETVTLVVWKAEDGSAIGTLTADASDEVYVITSLGAKECVETIDYVDGFIPGKFVGDYSLLSMEKKIVYSDSHELIGEYYIWGDEVFGFAAPTLFVNSDTQFLSVEYVFDDDYGYYWLGGGESKQGVAEDLIYDTTIEGVSVKGINDKTAGISHDPYGTIIDEVGFKEFVQETQSSINGLVEEMLNKADKSEVNNTEDWVFTLEDGTEVTKKVRIKA